MKRLLLAVLVMAPFYNFLLRAISNFITRGLDDPSYKAGLAMSDAESRLAGPDARSTFLHRLSLE